MPVTPLYDFPYPAPGDAPDGPTQLGSLANAVEDELARVDLGIRPLGLNANSNLTLTGTNQTVPGTQSTFTTNHPNAVCLVTAVWDMSYLNATADAQHMVGILQVDGADQTRQCLMRCMPNSRATVVQTFVLTFASASVHTIMMRARCNAAIASSATANAPNTGWSGILIDR